jgi:phage N-6-adenine-methyltransferase
MLNKGMFTSNTPEWNTPQFLFDKLDAEFRFTLDPCATAKNTKCEKFFTIEEDGLSKSWEGERVFCNPPYGRVIGNWIRKCVDEDTEICVALLPSRTDTRWFHDYIYHKAEIRFIDGRLKFDGKNRAPFPSMIVVFK